MVDACDTFNEAVRNAALQRLSTAGAVLINWFALACELQRDWRHSGEAMTKLCSKHLPDYGNLFASYNYTAAAATNAVMGKQCSLCVLLLIVFGLVSNKVISSSCIYAKSALYLCGPLSCVPVNPYTVRL